MYQFSLESLLAIYRKRIVICNNDNDDNNDNNKEADSIGGTISGY